MATESKDLFSEISDDENLFDVSTSTTLKDIFSNKDLFSDSDDEGFSVFGESPPLPLNGFNANDLALSDRGPLEEIEETKIEALVDLDEDPFFDESRSSENLNALFSGGEDLNSSDDEIFNIFDESTPHTPLQNFKSDDIYLDSLELPERKLFEKDEKTKAEEAKVEKTTVEAPKIEEAKIEAPKIEEAKVEAPKIEEATGEETSKEKEAQASDSSEFTDGEIALMVVAGAFVAAGVVTLFVFCPPAAAAAVFIGAKIGAATGLTAAAHVAIPVVVGAAKLAAGAIAGTATMAAGTVAGAATAAAGTIAGTATMAAGTVAGAATAAAGAIASTATMAAGTVAGAATAAAGTIASTATMAAGTVAGAATAAAGTVASTATAVAATALGKVAIVVAGAAATTVIEKKIEKNIKDASNFLSKAVDGIKQSFGAISGDSQANTAAVTSSSKAATK